MNVILSAYACNPFKGTEPGNGWNWAINLAPLVDNVTVVTRSGNQKDIEKYLNSNKIIENLEFIFIEEGALPNKMRYIYWQIKIFVHIVYILRKRKRRFDVIHHVTYGSVHGSSLLPITKIPVVFGPAGGGQVVPEKLLKFFGESQRLERIRNIITKMLPYSPFHRIIYRRTKINIPTNIDTRDLFERFGASGAIMLDAGIEESLIIDKNKKDFSKDGKLRIVWVGSLIPRKALCLTLDALSLLNIPFCMNILGDGPLMQDLKEYSIKLKLDGRVNFIGRVEREEVMNFYDQSDVMVFNSLRDSSPAQIIEAQARGVPIIGLRLHGLPQMVSQNSSILVDVDNENSIASDLAKAINLFFNLSLEDKRRMSNFATEKARENTWKIKAKNAIEIYQEAVK